MFKTTLVFFAVFAVVLASLAHEPLKPKPDKFKDKEGCYISELDDVIPVGHSAPSKTTCKEYRCGKTMLTHVRCGAIHADPPCWLVEDKKKPYPDCCPAIKCP